MSALFVFSLEAIDSLIKLGRTIALLLVRAAGAMSLGFRKLCLPVLMFAAHVLTAIPRAFRFLFITSKIGLTIAPIAIFFILAIMAITNPYMKADLDYAHERSSAAEIIDRHGRWLGIVPPANFADWSDGSILPPDHAAIPLLDIPPVWRTCLVFLEDREFDGISRWLGIDPMAILKSGWQTITLQRRRGASTLYMQVVRTLHGRSPGQHEAPGEVALRKAAELIGASALVRMFEGGDPRGALRFVGTHLPLVMGAPGSAFGEPLHGVELASRVLFGVPSRSLAPEQQAILAAAVKAPIIMAPPDDKKGIALAQTRWKRAKDRADFCLRSVFADSTAEISAARQRLAGLDLPQPNVGRSLAKFLPGDPRTAWKITVNPTRRALFFARQELNALMPELDRIMGGDWRGRVVSIRLSTSATGDGSFGVDVESVLRQLQSTVLGLQLNLTQSGTAGETADVVVACADSEGAIRRIYASRQGIFWNRKAPVGSVAKVVAAIALGRIDRPESLYCPAPIPGIPSSQDGDAEVCHDKKSWLSATEAFARSNNKAIHWALRRISNKTLEATAAGFKLPPFADTPPATALTIGTFELTPAELLHLVATIGTGLTDPALPVHNIHIIDQITTLDREGQVVTESPKGAATITTSTMSEMFTSRVRSFTRTVLRATSEKNGTLYSLHGLQEQLKGNLYAKTGTVSIAGSTRDIHIAGTYMQNGKPWSFMVTVGSPSNARPLGTRLAAGKFAPLAALAICRDSHSDINVARLQ